MDVVLLMLRADGSMRSFAVTKSETIIGRQEAADFRIPLPDVSRKHCRLVKDGQYVRVEDLGSSNGTSVNNQRVELAVLKPGDTLKVGPVSFVVQIDGSPGAAEVAARPAVSTVEETPARASAASPSRPAAPPGAPASEDEIDKILSSDPSDSDADLLVDFENDSK